MLDGVKYNFLIITETRDHIPDEIAGEVFSAKLDNLLSQSARRLKHGYRLVTAAGLRQPAMLPCYSAAKFVGGVP